MMIKGDERERRSPTNRNYAVELPTFGAIARVNTTGVQWQRLALGEPPWWSRLTPPPGKYELKMRFPYNRQIMRIASALSAFLDTSECKH